MTQTTQAPTRREIIKQELATLAFITRGGNWLFLLLSRLAEPLMFLSVLYVIAETVLPGLFKARMLLDISSACIIVLNTAPEVILPGCFMQANQAPEGQAWMYKAMGWVFIGLTFITLASFIWSFPAGAVSVILFFRCAAGVLYSLLVRMTPQRIDVTSTRQHQDQLDELTTRFSQQVLQLEKSFQQHLARELSQTKNSLHQQLNESSTLLARGVHQELLTELSRIDESFQQIERSISEQLYRMHVTLEKHAQKQATEAQKKIERPALRALPAVRQSASQAVSEEKFDARAFVFACLQENADLKLSEIEQRALSAGQELSQPSISRYRKQFFAKNESSTLVDDESSATKAVEPDESFTDERERMVVGE
jgi:hypothetical protein